MSQKLGSTTFLSSFAKAILPETAEVSVYQRPDRDVYEARIVIEHEELFRWNAEQRMQMLARKLELRPRQNRPHMSRFWARRVRGSK